MAADPDGTRAKHREEENASRQKRFAADPEAVRAKERGNKAKSRTRKRNADPDGFKAKVREDKAKSRKRNRNAAKQNFLKEIRFGPFFVCECCNTQHFFHNVVKKTPALIQQIHSSAKDASIREYNSKIKQVI